MIASNVALGDELTIIVDSEIERVEVVALKSQLLPAAFVVQTDDHLNRARYRFRLCEEGQTWARGWDTEDARALEATVLLQRSAG